MALLRPWVGSESSGGGGGRVGSWWVSAVGAVVVLQCLGWGRVAAGVSDHGV